ncbi:tRNA pseudouridine38-40 synthase [Melghiribacillus thermohalophilus]|uniref:tRNA pseudouridine synthase A n=1 Tax=Melghiribacillus thermohalophilus TaxID=1324956 RepID=A0A4R3N359_9BACI|nr:tRNA pseudouridine38-40 synthase [Melghiribacillus thermohalophilus]
MERMKCTLQYDGTFFYGFQVQPEKRTVQQEVEEALQKIHKGQLIRITPSGRTDAGVHAIGQVIHFDSPLRIQEENWKNALCSLLPDDIYVDQVEKVSESFHARYDVKEKEYRYKIYTGKKPDIFRRNYSYQLSRPLNLDRMNEACRFLIGTHDFTSFSSARATVKGDKIRTIYDAGLFQDEDEVIFRVKGNGFLYHMVRIMVGTLIEVGIGKRSPDEIKEIIAGEDRALAGKTAPPQGLYLWKVSYE